MSLARLVLASLAAAMLAAAAPAPASDEAAAKRVRADVEFLASDLLEGRDTGSRGHDIAAAYVASQFRAIGLQPGGTGGSWYLQVPLRRARHLEPPKASLTIGKQVIQLSVASDFAAAPSLTQQSRILDAPLVFVGHGVSDRELGIDEYAGLDVRGKIAIAIEGTPAGLASEVAAHLESVKAATAAAKGAAGLIQIAGTGIRPAFNRLAYAGQPVVDWVEPDGKAASARAALGLNAAISRTVAQRLFAAARKDLDGVLAGRGRRSGMRGFDIPARLALSDRMAWQDFTSPQVIGILPGADPGLSSESVVLMGHLDHLGVEKDPDPGQDPIFNGAIDNAAGIATMLETARAFVASGKPPRRSVLFVANTGEERGLRGAEFFAAHPTVAPGSIVGLVNIDMPMLLYEFTDIIAFGADHSTVGRTVADAARSMGITVSPDPMPEQAIFTRSDHYPFVVRGTPAVMLATGHANGGAAVWNRFFGHTYHKVSDDLSQPIRWDQGARFADLNYRIARSLADSEQRPLWYQKDYFGETFAPRQPKAKR